MTNKEAILELEWIYQNGFENDLSIVGTDRILDSIRMAIEALEKQIQKKPKVVTRKHYTTTICPKCNKDLTFAFGKYCNGCGQRLDSLLEVE